MSIFIGQDLDITLVGDIDLSTASPRNIRYEKPDASTGEVTATAGGVGNVNAVGALTPAILDTAGTWKFFIEAVISAKVNFSSVATFQVETPITDPS